MRSAGHFPHTALFAACTSILAGALLAGCGGRTDAQAPLPGPSVASVNGEPVSAKLLDAFGTYRNLDLSKPQLRERAISQITDLVLMEQAARQAGYLNDPEFAAAAELGRLQGISTAAAKLFRQESQIDDAAVRAEYERQSANVGQEYEFAQLVFATQEEAARAAAEVAAGKSFDQVLEAHRKDARVARQFPKTRSAQLPAPLTAALAALKPGESSKQPLQLPQGWGLLRLTSAAAVPPPPFEQVKENIRRMLARRAGDERIAKLRADAKITLSDAAAPPPAPAAAAPAAAPASQP
jgi:peptidyl-prolyl cis-trans isomerase C